MDASVEGFVERTPNAAAEAKFGQDRRTSPIPLLTAQELECLRWCKEGKTNWEIGEILSISQKTVEFHVGNAMRKLGAGNRITAVIMGIKTGLIAL
jgi:DNA-binding CsgD family transcriptional regulator